MTDTITGTATGRDDGTASDHVIVVSSDSHVGPRLEIDLRPYCPAAHLDEFDAWATANQDAMEADRQSWKVDESDPTGGASTEAAHASHLRRFLNQRTEGHYDVHTRLREMDWDGVAAEVIYHGSQNGETLPFVGIRDYLVPLTTGLQFDRVATGYRIYNRWLADFVSVEPERHVGLAYIPMWDVERAIEELRWAADAGLRGVNFPAPRPGIAEYDDPVWEPFWSACEDHDMMLSTHAGVPRFPITGPQTVSIMVLEVAGWPNRRGMHRLIFGGVFERHPGLRLILTEQMRGWWSATMRELDHAYGVPTEALRAQVPRQPSEYMANNVFLGYSFMGPSTAEEAVREGYVPNVLWGSDYPHGEGTYKFPESVDEPSMTRSCLRWAFADRAPDETRAMLGENAIHAYNLDRAALARVAARIGPTLDEITTPLDTLPHGWHDDFHGQ